MKRVGRIALYVLCGFAVFLVAIILYNGSWFESPHGDGRIKLIAHRGVHQTFPSEGLENDTCTAERIRPPAHGFLENTLPSMEAAFAAGADVVELDVHLTPDMKLAVMHDWTVDCRTEGTGQTDQLSMNYLKTLDVGHGYTADGGKSFPLRGTGVGMIPVLDEVLERFPDKKFLVNFKSRRAEEGAALAELIHKLPAWREALWGVYGGAEPTEMGIKLIDGLEGYTNRSIVSCATSYVLSGWTGIVPDVCRNTMVYVPSNYAWLMWGWPHKFTKRMAEAGSTVILLGSFDGGDLGTSGIDSIEEISAIPEGFAGYVWTNRVEVVGPQLRRQGR